MTHERVADDLGVGFGGGKHRAAVSGKKRRAKAGRRANRVRTLARRNPRATMLYLSGVTPQGEFSQLNQGVPQSVMVTLRRQAARCCQPAGGTCCSTTLIWWRMGPHDDPQARIPVNQAKLYLQLYKSESPAIRRAMRRLWNAQALLFEAGARGWHSVAGPLLATLATMRDIGFNVLDHEAWVGPKGDVVRIADTLEGCTGPFLAVVQEAAKAAAWRSAAAHDLAAGLGEGVPALGPARVARRRLCKEGTAASVAALDAVVCGGLWRHSRGQRCQCGEPDSPHHRYWGCTLLRDSTCEAVRETAFLAPLFQEGGELSHLECLWGRAIMPAAMFEAAPDTTLDSLRTWKTEGFDELAAAVPNLCTDGSGGPEDAPKTRPRVGAGVAVLAFTTDGPDDSAITLTGVEAMGGAVAGRQTVPRAEAQAAAMAMRASGAPAVVLHVDASYVVKGHAASGEARRKLRCGTNADMWIFLDEQAPPPPRSVQVQKVAAQSTSVDLVAGCIAVPIFLGNAVADVAATAAASREHARSTATSFIAKWEKHTAAIAARLAAIEEARWARGPELVEPPAALPEHEPLPLAEAHSVSRSKLADAGHRLFAVDGVIFCERCRRRSRRGLEAWTAPCPGRFLPTAQRPRGRASQHETQICAANAAPAAAAVPAGNVPHPPAMVHVMERVTFAQRRKMVREQNSELKHRRLNDNVVQIAADDEAIKGVAACLSDAPVVNYAVLERHDTDATHVLFECGGFIGCWKCGGIAGHRPSALLSARCRRHCPEGSSGPIRRLARGQWPHVQRSTQGKAWPSGESQPAVRLILRS